MKTCSICNKTFNLRRKYCSSECTRESYKSDEFRNIQSKNRKRFLKNNPEKHPWKKNSKFISEPCERLKKFLDDRGIKYIEEYRVIEDRYFSIDIAFPDIKVGIEVNGNQHYNRDGTLKDYYKNRHDIISSYGWKLIELHYSCCFNNSILETLIQKYEQPDYTVYIKPIKTVLPKGEKNKLNSEARWNPYKDKVINSQIDFKKLGWVKKVSLILGIKEQKVSPWMKRHLKEFYEKECYKRKSVLDKDVNIS